MATGSINLTPNTQGPFSLFITSQLRTKPVPPPKGLSLSGQTGILTGATSGIGSTCAELLLNYGLSRLIIGVRSISRGEARAAELRKAYPAATVHVWSLDMDSYKSVQEFAQRCNTLSRIDFAVLGAAIAPLRWGVNKETGHEQMLQVNYLSTTLLSMLLLPTLKAKAPAGSPGRLTIVGSGTSMLTQFPYQKSDPIFAGFDDPAGWNLARQSDTYAGTKLMLHMFLVKLVEFVPATSVVVNVVDPGLVKGTELNREASGLVKIIFELLKSLTARTLEQGAWTYIDAANVRGPESHGCYLMDYKIFPFGSLLYTPKGKEVTERVWRETLKELSFADVQTILDRMRS